MISFGFRTLHVVMTLRIASSQRKKHKVLKETTHRRKPRWCKTNRLSKANTETKKPSLIKLVTQIELKLLARQGNKLIQVCIKITWWYTPNTLMLEYWITDNPHWDCNCRPTQQRIWEKDILIVIAKTPARYSPYRGLYWLLLAAIKPTVEGLCCLWKDLHRTNMHQEKSFRWNVGEQHHIRQLKNVNVWSYI